MPSAADVLKLNAIQVLAIACFGVALGLWVKRRVPALDRLNIPAAILGGLAFAVVTLALRAAGVQLEMDLVLRDLLMVTFFTTIGMTASLRLVRQGGVQVVIFLVLATVGALLQNGVGIGLAKVMGLSPLLGIVAGSVALTGGPATALAFGATFEAAGVAGATTLGVAAAMFGITAGGLLGGFIGGQLVRRNALHPLPGTRGTGAPVPPSAGPAADIAGEVSGEMVRPHVAADAGGPAEAGPVFNTIATIAISMGLGTLISAAVERTGVVLPSYVGAMLVAAVLRNLDDRFRFVRISEEHVEATGNLSLSIFIVMALMTLRLWEIASLAGPILAMLAVQLALVSLLCLAIFRLMGRDYEAAVMSAGYVGFMLGTTANAMACMGVLTAKHGPAPRAYLVVPIVGAFLIDFTNASLVTVLLNLLH